MALLRATNDHSDVVAPLTGFIIVQLATGEVRSAVGRVDDVESLLEHSFVVQLDQRPQ